MPPGGAGARVIDETFNDWPKAYCLSLSSCKLMNDDRPGKGQVNLSLMQVCLPDGKDGAVDVKAVFVHWLWSKSVDFGGGLMRQVPLTSEEILSMPGRIVTIKEKRVQFATEAWAPRRFFNMEKMLVQNVGVAMRKTAADREKPVVPDPVLRLRSMANAAIGFENFTPELRALLDAESSCAHCLKREAVTCPFCLLAWHVACSKWCVQAAEGAKIKEHRRSPMRSPNLGIYVPCVKFING